MDRGSMRCAAPSAPRGEPRLFSSLTVAGALASLLRFPQRFLYSMGIGGAAVTLVAALIATLVLPALLALLGARVNALSPRWLARRAEREARPDSAGFFYRVAAFTGRAPGRTAAASIVVLVALALPALGLHFTYPDGGVLPATASARQVNDALHSQFPPYRDSPITLAVTGRGTAEQVVGQARRLPHVAALQPPLALAHDQFAVNVISRDGPITSHSEDLVRRLRALPARPLVTGATAHYLDMQSSIARHLPAAALIVITITLAALFLMTRSIVLPIKQVLMNALGLGAMYGLLSLVFQHTPSAELLGTVKQAGIEEPQLVLLFVVVFGLSTDYGVFLLSRIKEARDASLPNSEAIGIGLERTGRIVTAAALLFAVAFGSVHHLPPRDQQGARPRTRRRRADRCDTDPRPARPIADAPPRPLELVDTARPQPAPNLHSIPRQHLMSRHPAPDAPHQDSQRERLERSAALPTTTQLITRVDFVPFSTRDIDAACAFYGTTLGLPRSVYVPERHYAEFETDNVTISIVDGEKMRIGHHVNTIALALHVEDVAAARATLEERGVRFQGDTLDTGVCHMGFFSDPDGNALMLHHRYAPRIDAA